MDAVDSFRCVKECHIRSHFTIILLTILVAACSRSAFDQQHKEAVLQNPPGIELEIRTSGGRNQFAVSEPVAFEEFYTSKFPGAWRIEVLEGWNVSSNATSSDVVHITDGKTLWNQPRQQWVGIICCDSRQIWLDQEPVRIPYKLSATPTHFNPEGLANLQWQTFHLPNKPGKYRVYVTTHRVFERGSDKNPYHDKGFPVSSNILDLQVK
jgi:hypothetical protein